MKVEETNKIKKLYDSSRKCFQFMALLAAKECSIGLVGEPYNDVHKLFGSFSDFYELKEILQNLSLKRNRYSCYFFRYLL